MTAAREADPAGGRRLLLLYPVLAFLAFPTFGVLLAGTGAWMETLDVFDDGGGLPRLAMVVRDWTAHGLTLWNPSLTSGNAFLGQFALSPLAPDTALAFLIGPYPAFAVSVWVTATIAGIGMHLFLRDGLRLATPAAVGGAIFAVFCFWHPIYGISIAVFPLILWLGDRASDRSRGAGRRWPAVAAVLVGALSLYAGQIQIVVFVVAIQLAWIVMTRDRPDRLEGIRVWLVTWVLAFALYGPVLLTQLLLVGLSERQIWDLGYLFGGTVSDAIGTVIDHYGRLLVGVPVGNVGPSTIRYGTIFLGGLGLPLAVIGIVAGRRTRATRFVLLLLVAIPILDAAAIVATSLQEHLGILRSFQGVRIRHFFPFALDAAVALGIDALVRLRVDAPDNRLRAGSRTRRIAMIGAALALVPVAIQLVPAAQHAWTEIRARRIDGPVDVGWVLGAAGLGLGLLAGLGLLVVLRRGGRRLVGSLLIAAFAVLIGERALLSNGSPLFGNDIGTFDDHLALTPAQSFLLAQPGIAGQRVLTFGDDANRMAFQGLRQVDGYQAIFPLAYHGFFGALIGPGLALDADLARYYGSWGARAYAFRPEVDPELVDLVGTRWLYVRDGTTPTVPDLVERFRDDQVTVFENPGAFPRAFLVGAIDSRPDQDAVLAALSAASVGDLRGAAILTPGDLARLGDGGASIPTAVTGGSAPVASADAGAQPFAGSATISRDDPDTITIDIQPTAPAVLVLTDVWSPGWVAKVDGRSVPIAQVDAAFRGIAVDPSSRQVTLRYEPGFTAIGLLGAIGGVVLLAGWGWWIGRAGRRDAPAPGDASALDDATAPDDTTAGVPG